MTNPQPDQIRTAREYLQARRGLGITAAQTQCAALVHTTCRVWQQWENADRKMHPAFWELFRIKSEPPGRGSDETVIAKNQE